MTEKNLGDMSDAELASAIRAVRRYAVELRKRGYSALYGDDYNKLSLSCPGYGFYITKTQVTEL